MTKPADKQASHQTQAGLAAMRVLARARAWAYFAIGADGARLLASDKIDRGCLDHVGFLARAHAAPELPAGIHDTTRCRLILAFPRVVSAQDHGLLYLEDPPAHPSLGLLLDLHIHELDALLRARVDRRAPILARVKADTAAHEPEAESLRALLEHQEWSIARVARLLGVTRMTVYNRMRRHGVQRIKFRTPPRREDS